MKQITQFTRVFAGAMSLLLGAAFTAQASTTYHVAFDTSSLIGHMAGPFYLDFQFIDGASVGNANNTATLANFDFGGGSADGLATLDGGASGSFANEITFTDSSFFNGYFQSFTPGTTFAFDLTLTGVVEDPAPDAFSFGIVDGNLFNLPTTHPTNNSLFYVELGGESVLSSGIGDFSNVTGDISAVPESGSTLAGLVLLGCCMEYVRRRARRQAA